MCLLCTHTLAWIRKYTWTCLRWMGVHWSLNCLACLITTSNSWQNYPLTDHMIKVYFRKQTGQEARGGLEVFICRNKQSVRQQKRGMQYTLSSDKHNGCRTRVCKTKVMINLLLMAFMKFRTARERATLNSVPHAASPSCGVDGWTCQHYFFETHISIQML